MLEWLWDVRHRFSVIEYVVRLSTFGFIQWWTVEYVSKFATGTNGFDSQMKKSEDDDNHYY
jgi:hypothetical protein